MPFLLESSAGGEDCQGGASALHAASSPETSYPFGQPNDETAWRWYASFQAEQMRLEDFPSSRHCFGTRPSMIPIPGPSPMSIADYADRHYRRGTGDVATVYRADGDLAGCQSLT